MTNRVSMSYEKVDWRNLCHM